MSVQQQDPLLSVAEAGEYVGRNERFVREMVAKRSIEHIKVGGLLRFRQSALDNYLADQTRRAVIVRTRVVTQPPTRRKAVAR